MKNRFLHIAIRRTLQIRGTSVLGECPNESAFAAYLEHNLGEDERARIEEHASNCAGCQQILALALKLAEPEHVEKAEDQSADARQGVFIRLWRPIPVLATVLIAIAAFGLLVRLNREYSSTPTETVALRQAEKMPTKDEMAPPVGFQTETAPGEQVPPRTEASAVVAEKAGKTSSPSQIAPAINGVRPAPATKAWESAQATIAARKQEPVEEVAAAQAAKARQEPGVTAADAVSGTGAKEAKTAETGPMPQPAAKPAVTVAVAELQSMRYSQTKESKGVVEYMKLAQADLVESPEEAIRRVVREIAEQRSELSRRVWSDRIFYRSPAYWVDRQCATEPDAVITEITVAAEEFQQIEEALPEILELLSSEIPVLFRWNGKNYLIRLAGP